MSVNTPTAPGNGDRRNNLDMAMIHGQAAGIVRRGVVLLAILLLLSSATLCQLSISAADSPQHRMNVTACGYGLFDCNESQLTPGEVAEVIATRHRVNVTACGYGFLGCSESLLTTSEVAEVNAIRRRINTLAPGYDLPAPELLGGAAPQKILGPSFVWPLAVAENGSYYGELNKNGVPKTVHVNGYFRSNGTYVRGYYRSAPGTNPR